MEICHCCRKPVKDRDVQWAERYVSRATMLSPAEYEDVPLCQQCYAFSREERDEAYERAAARYDGEGKDWR